MSEAIVLNAGIRSTGGTAASRRMRRIDGLVPGVVYGGGEAPVSISMKSNELKNAMGIAAFFSQVLTVDVGGTPSQVVVRELQRHPASERVIHVDFLRVRLDQAVHVSVPLHFVHEDACVGVKLGGGNITHNMVEVEVSALPNDLPAMIEVDMTEIEVGKSVHLSDLALPPAVQIVAFLHGDEAAHDLPVATVLAPRGGGVDDDGSAAGEGEAGAGDESGGDA